MLNALTTQTISDGRLGPLLTSLILMMLMGCNAERQFDSAVADINREGFAASKPLPDVRVFVPRTGRDEKSIDDDRVAAVVPALNRLPGLGEVDLTRSGITDRSLAALAKVPRLRRINITDTQVTEVGLEHLKSLPNLESLHLREGQLDEGELRHLHDVLPHVTIYLLGRSGFYRYDPGPRVGSQ